MTLNRTDQDISNVARLVIIEKEICFLLAFWGRRGGDTRRPFLSGDDDVVCTSLLLTPCLSRIEIIFCSGCPFPDYER